MDYDAGCSVGGEKGGGAIGPRPGFGPKPGLEGAGWMGRA